MTGLNKYFIGAINNEPLELNRYRIEPFDLRQEFRSIFQFVLRAIAKTGRDHIFRMALEVSQRPPAECLFIDDRPLNLEVPRRLGMNVIHYQDAEGLRAELRNYDVEV